MKILPVIMCGGNGSRLWPISTKNNPKQFMKFLDNDKSLLQLTVLRFENQDKFLPPIFLTNHLYLDCLKNQLTEIGIQNPTILVEPCVKNNAPAITIASLYLKDKNINNHILIIPSDAYIENFEYFLTAFNESIDYLNNNDSFILFGIKPTYAETGFGYIKPIKNENNSIQKIETFLEKPNKDNAELFIQNGCLWNSGIFMFNTNTYLSEIKKYDADLYNNAIKTYNNSTFKKNLLLINKEDYSNFNSISIDYAVIEKTNLASVITIKNSNWSDVGSFDAVYNLSKKDENNNVITGNVIALNCKNCYIYSNDTSLLAVANIQNQIIINSNGVYLNISLTTSQDVKLFNEKLLEREDKCY